MKRYRFTATGCGSGGATFSATGELDAEFADVFNLAMFATFHQLTHGKAVYGSPGIGCQGPYDIRSVVIEQVPQ